MNTKAINSIMMKTFVILFALLGATAIIAGVIFDALHQIPAGLLCFAVAAVLRWQLKQDRKDDDKYDIDLY